MSPGFREGVLAEGQVDRQRKGGRCSRRRRRCAQMLKRRVSLAGRCLSFKELPNGGHPKL